MKAKMAATAVAWLMAWPLAAQLGSWNVLQLRYKLNPRFSLMAEGQLRSLRFYDHFHYYEFKGGLSYHINPQFYVLTGAGRYNTYRSGGDFVKPAQQREIRTWLEIVSRQSVGRVRMEHRYRAEQRYTSNGYRNRFRYRLALSVPINKPKLENKTFFALAWNELFLRNVEPYFERNRSMVGLGYKLAQHSFQTGILYQFDYRLDDETGKSFFVISWTIELDGKHSDSENPLPMQEG
jgi:hypothetical protein